MDYSNDFPRTAAVRNIDSVEFAPDAARFAEANRKETGGLRTATGTEEGVH